MSKTLLALEEWSWVFGIYSGIAYGEHLKGNKIEVVCHPNSEPFFYWLDSITPATHMGDFRQSTSQIYNRDFNPKTLYPNWTPPPYQQYYSQFFKPEDERDVLVISNKYNREWGRPPVNFLSLELLEEVFDKLSSKYKIYYIRYDGNARDGTQQYYDEVSPLAFGDYELTRKYNIETIYDVIDQYKAGFNTAQMYIHSAAKYSIACAGGNSILSAFFGKEMIQWNCPSCPSAKREVWQSDTWLKILNNVKIIGHNSYNDLVRTATDRWLYEN